MDWLSQDSHGPQFAGVDKGYKGQDILKDIDSWGGQKLEAT